MVGNIFESLLEDVGKELKMHSLKPDEHQSCLLKFPANVFIQLELNKEEDSLMLGADLGVLPPGRYRENVFREALKANGLPLPHQGDFAFSQHKDKLVLTVFLPLKSLNGEKIMACLTSFYKKAHQWKEAIERGEVPVVITGGYESTARGGVFGLKP